MFAFAMTGHTMTTFLVSFLVVAKIKISYERCIKARRALGDGLSRLRDLNQLAMSYTFHGTFAKGISIATHGVYN